MDSDSKKMKKDSGAVSGGDEVLNVRKAIRFASKGKGSAALARGKLDGKKSKRR